MKNNIQKVPFKAIMIFFVLLLPLMAYPQNRPNILWIICDDLGRELSCYRHPLVQTPNIDKLANEGVLYTNAYANTPVCSASRSSLITGMYPSSIHCLNHRSMQKKALPDEIKPITEYLSKEGYFISNANGLDLNKKGKMDYNFSPGISYEGTDWRQCPEGQVFFAQIQIKYPHRPFSHQKAYQIDPDKVTLPGCYPNHPLLRADWARYLEAVQKCDSVVGEVLSRLKADGRLNNTIIFFFGDHGRPHLRDKQFLYEGGLQIPLIIRWPNKVEQGKTDDQLVSLVDVAASTLGLAQVPVPKHIHGKDFLNPLTQRRKFIFGFRQRGWRCPG